MNDMNTSMITHPSDGSGTAMSLVMNTESMTMMTQAAKLMASAKVTIPQHLRNSEGDCMAVIMQAAQWRMNPFAVAQKTHLTQGGALGYEAQLVNAVIVSCGAIKGQPEFEFIGDWNKILGKVEERKSDKGGKYYVPGWKPQDEEGLGVIVTASLAGETKPRTITIMLTQCYPRFSTQWATDPQQQITYVGVRKFARRYAPGAILGVYTKDELEAEQAEIDVTPGAAPVKAEAPKKADSKYYPDDQFKKVFPKFKAGIEKGNNTPQDALDFIVAKGFAVTAEQRAAIEAIKAPISGESATVQEPQQADTPTFASIAAKLNDAKDMAMLDAAADLIGELDDETQRLELGDLFNARRIELEG